MQETKNQELKAVFFILSGIILITFAITTFIEGILSQIQGYSLVSLVFYFVSMCSVGATFWTYSKGKNILKTIY